MATQVLNYIRTANSLCDDLLSSHRDLLGHKNIWRKQDLIQAIKFDIDKLTHALFEVRENRAPSVLRNFFGDTPVNVPEICARLADDRIYHVGFEIHEPLDLVLRGIDHWIAQSKRATGSDMRVSDYMRFPPSSAFQERIGASAEIMRIWLQVNDRNLMLELFDIQRPTDAVLAAAPKSAHRNFNGLFHHKSLVPGHRERIASLFANDEIWHYAFYVRHPEEVIRLHADWQALAAQDPGYFVPYAAPIHNRYDGSFHTKVIRKAGPVDARLELEFVTKYAGH